MGVPEPLTATPICTPNLPSSLHPLAVLPNHRPNHSTGTAYTYLEGISRSKVLACSIKKERNNCFRVTDLVTTTTTVIIIIIILIHRDDEICARTEPKYCDRSLRTTNTWKTPNGIRWVGRAGMSVVVEDRTSSSSSSYILSYLLYPFFS